MKKLDLPQESNLNKLKFDAAILSSIQDAVIGTDTEYKIISWNKGAEKLYGWTQEEVLGKFVLEVIPTELIDQTVENWESQLRKKGQWKEEVLQKRRDGKMMHIFASTAFVKDESGKVIGLVSINRDITAFKKSQEELKRSEERFKKLFEKSSDVIAIVDENAHRVFSTPSVKTILGYEPHDHLGGAGLAKIHPDDLPRSLKMLEDIKKTPGKTIFYKQRIQHKDGSWIWVEGTATNLLNEPSVRGIVLNYRDVTERIKNEQRKDDFIAMASHELKTPLTSAKVLTQVLEKQISKEADTQSQKLLGKMNKSLDKLDELVRNLLDVSKIQQGKLQITKEKFQIRELVKDIIGDLEPITKHKLLTDWHTEEYVFADKERIRQVLVNLITNAIKYSPDADKIVIRSNSVDGFVEITVQDCGIGIAKSEQEKIFDRFYQANAHNTYPGLGLGLFISNEIIKANGGKMWVESEEGKGSTFYFRLPVSD